MLIYLKIGYLRIKKKIMNIKKIAKKIFNKFGLNISRYKKYPEFLLYHKIELLFDVGANFGQYAMHIRDNGYKGRIVSFEPLPDAHEKLQKKLQK